MVYTASADVEVEGISKPQSASHYKLCAFHTMVTLTLLCDAEMTQPVTQQDTRKQQIDLLHEMPLRYTGVTLWRNADILKETGELSIEEKLYSGMVAAERWTLLEMYMADVVNKDLTK